MVEAEVTKNNKTIGKLEYDSLYLLNDAKNILQDKSLESFRDYDDNMDEIVGKVLLLNTKLLKKMIEIKKKIIEKIMKNYL